MIELINVQLVRIHFTYDSVMTSIASYGPSLCNTCIYCKRCSIHSSRNKCLTISDLYYVEKLNKSLSIT